jgi:hypothetical protein
VIGLIDITRFFGIIIVMATIIMSLREDPNIQRFVNSANHFCELLEVQSINSDRWVEQILKALSELYSSAHHLPDNEISDGTLDEESYDVNNNEWKVIFDRVASIFGEQRYYWEYFDPSEPIDANNEPVVGDLADDLADIYRDIKPGLCAWDVVNDELLADVVFDWKYPNFGSHWGDHALSAMRVLHPLCFMGGIQNDHSK